ncbi:DUF3426 domain-containing protein [Azoarcus olearius]|uniref:Zinc finger/thioredoxin putative domain-containing protein n=1 Tax=Azoarcus sp. (strain BH72) TaxID=418699 RepID=A1K3S2_AZOSB|nr:DUF3426 domain-containing protein [Azoarcus olearius]CAL93477.1 Hypothetical protein azo0860 [Azoarcus olearius]
MLTRCPACQTIFRLRPEQLRARHGEVRCGHCFNPFNALDHLLEGQQAQESAASEPGYAEPPSPPLTPPLTPPTQPAPLQPPPSAAPPATTSAFSDLEFDLPDGFDTAETPLQADADEKPFTVEPPAAPHVREPMFAPDADHAPQPAPTPEHHDDVHGGAPRVDFSAMVAAAGSRLAGNPIPDPVFPLEGNRRDAPEPSGPAAHRIEPLVEDMPSPEPVVAFEHEPRDEPAARDNAEPAAWIAPASDLPSSEDASGLDSDHLDAHYGPPPAAGPGSRLIPVTVLLLALVLFAQSAYLFRGQISRALPGLRPLYVSACAQLGCDMPLPRDAMLINIESPDLQSEPGRPGRYILHATIQNRADYPQAWPHLELTLTDPADVPLVRRVLAPEEWYGSSTLPESFKARSDATVRLNFEAPDIAPTGYRVYVFYP